MSSITLTGNTIIPAQILEAESSYAQQINLGFSASEEENLLKHTLVNLHTAIGESGELSPFQRKSSLTDIDSLTAELCKPALQQDKGIIKGFWSRLKETLSHSEELTRMNRAVGKLLGLAI